MRNIGTTIFILSILLAGLVAAMAVQAAFINPQATAPVIRTGQVLQPVISSDSFGLPLSSPQNVTSTLVSGGSLSTSTTYYYTVTAFDGTGGESVASAEVSTSPTSTTRTSRISWSAVKGAVSYVVYRATSSNQYTATSTAVSTTSLTFDDATTTLSAGTPPSNGDAYVNKIASSSDSWFNGGNVGIGTSTPSVLLHLFGASSTLRLGCIAWDDRDGGGLSYTTALDGVLTTTTTKPNVCQ